MIWLQKSDSPIAFAEDISIIKYIIIKLLHAERLDELLGRCRESTLWSLRGIGGHCPTISRNALTALE